MGTVQGDVPITCSVFEWKKIFVMEKLSIPALLLLFCSISKPPLEATREEEEWRVVLETWEVTWAVKATRWANSLLFQLGPPTVRR
jgi:hypothetical protein